MEFVQKKFAYIEDDECNGDDDGDDDDANNIIRTMERCAIYFIDSHICQMSNAYMHD